MKTMTSDSKAVWIIEDEPFIAESLSEVLQKAGYQSCCFQSGQELLAAIPLRKAPLCFVVDFKLPDTNGMALVKLLRDKGYWQPFLVISGHASIRDTVEFMNLGAVTILEKPFSQERFLEVVGKAEELFPQLHGQEAIRTRIAELSARELEVLEAMNSGGDAEELADKLGISKKTLAVHKNRIFKKLGVNSTAEVIASTNFHFRPY